MFLKAYEDKKYAEDILEGKLYCNTIDFFKKAEAKEDNECRNDSLEGCAFLLNKKESAYLTTTIDGKEEILAEIRDLKIFNQNLNFKKIFCVYSFLEECQKDYFLIDEKFLSMGKYFLLIFYPDEFIERIHKTLKEKEYTFEYNFVEYVDSTKFSGKWEYFKKDKKYEYQKEFRIYFESKEKDAEILNIGNISDIAMVCSKKEFLNMKIGNDFSDNRVEIKNLVNNTR